VKIVNGEDLLIGVCYCSPNVTFSSKDNDKLLCDLITEVHNRPLLLMGDFNLPVIDCSLYLGTSVATQKIVDCIDEALLTQHVTQPTRKNSVLDLVLTSEPEMIDTISVLGSLGRSDHNILSWTTQLSPTVILLIVLVLIIPKLITQQCARN